MVCCAVAPPTVHRACFEFVGGFLELPGAGGEDSALSAVLGQFFRGRCAAVVCCAAARKRVTTGGGWL